MTQPPLPPRETWNALPEIGFSRRRVTIDGKEVWGVFAPNIDLHWLEEHEKDTWVDAEGNRWKLALSDGKWHKLRKGKI